MSRSKDFLRKITQPAPPPVDPLRGRPFGEPPAPHDEHEPGLQLIGGHVVGPGVDGIVKLETPEERAERLADEGKQLRELQERRQQAWQATARPQYEDVSNDRPGVRAHELSDRRNAGLSPEQVFANER